ncbi:hypothetical protein LWI29_025048 [Acer saccharum]|uniref:Flavin-containing monooxygenase n=1 Tax=Acer saccharum TaxID=4024 RepID=A0AA39S2W6_ACESA|nr:hypothetical protein LWI29_025048 [Acer saccharum]
MDYAAMDYESATNFVKGKQVIVVGFHKSALDIAMECSEGLKNQCTVLYRTEQWNVPANLLWGLPLTCLCLNRFSELLEAWRRIPTESFGNNAFTTGSFSLFTLFQPHSIHTNRNALQKD